MGRVAQANLTKVRLSNRELSHHALFTKANPTIHRATNTAPATKPTMFTRKL